MLLNENHIHLQKKQRMVKKLSVSEYSEYRKANGHKGSRQYVLKCLSSNSLGNLGGVLAHERVGNIWVLTVDTKYYEKLSMQAGKGLQPTTKK